MSDFPGIKHWILVDKKPKSVDLMEWASWIENKANKIVKQEHVGCVFVSTVFLGIDHSFSLNPDAQPILFETMIFGGVDNDYQKRCCTYVQAQSMHNVAVALCRRRLLLNWAIYPYQKLKKWRRQRQWRLIKREKKS